MSGTLPARMRQRRATAAWWTTNNPVLLDGELDTVARMDMAEAHAAAGIGVHEVRTWLAAFAALHAMGHTGPHSNSLSHYTPVPLWNAGFGILAVGGEAKAQSGSKEAAWISA